MEDKIDALKEEFKKYNMELFTQAMDFPTDSVTIRVGLGKEGRPYFDVFLNLQILLSNPYAVIEQLILLRQEESNIRERKDK